MVAVFLPVWLVWDHYYFSGCWLNRKLFFVNRRWGQVVIHFFLQRTQNTSSVSNTTEGSVFCCWQVLDAAFSRWCKHGIFQVLYIFQTWTYSGNIFFPSKCSGCWPLSCLLGTFCCCFSATNEDKKCLHFQMRPFHYPCCLVNTVWIGRM